ERPDRAPEPALLDPPPARDRAEARSKRADEPRDPRVLADGDLELAPKKRRHHREEDVVAELVDEQEQKNERDLVLLEIASKRASVEAERALDDLLFSLFGL